MGNAATSIKALTHYKTLQLEAERPEDVQNGIKEKANKEMLLTQGGTDILAATWDGEGERRNDHVASRQDGEPKQEATIVHSEKQQRGRARKAARSTKEKP